MNETFCTLDVPVDISIEPPRSVTRMRVAEVRDEIIIGEVLTDTTGKIVLVGFVSKEREREGKAVIVIERKKDMPRKEYFLQRQQQAQEYPAIVLGGFVYVLKSRATNRTLREVHLVKNQIIHRYETEGNRATRREKKAEEREQPATDHPAVWPLDFPHSAVWYGVGNARKTPYTEMFCCIIRGVAGTMYTAGAVGPRTENGIEKQSLVALTAPGLTRTRMLQTIARYNAYVQTGLKGADVAELPSQQPACAASPAATCISPSPFIAPEMHTIIQPPSVQTNTSETFFGAPVLEERRFFLDLVYYILVERRVMLVAKEEYVVANFLHALLGCIWPLEWKGILFAPLRVSSECIGLVQATVPYLIGLAAEKGEALGILQGVPIDTVIAWVDEQRIEVWGRKKGVLSAFRKKNQNRKTLPFYDTVIRKMPFEWPALRTEMNVLIEVVMAQAWTSREKVVLDILERRVVPVAPAVPERIAGGNESWKDRREELLRDFVNGLEERMPEMLEHIRMNRPFFRDFLSTSLYHAGLALEYAGCTPISELPEQEAAAVLWLCCWTSEKTLLGEGQKEIEYLLRSFLSSFLSASPAAAEALVVSLTSVLSALGSYRLVVCAWDILVAEVRGREQTWGIGGWRSWVTSAITPELTQGQLACLRKALAGKKEVEKKEKDEKKRCPVDIQSLPTSSPPVLSAPLDSSSLALSEHLVFVGDQLYPTISKYVCGLGEEPEKGIRQEMSRVFTRFGLPWDE